jgi:hypothetical protein
MESDERAVPHRAVLGDLHSLRERYFYLMMVNGKIVLRWGMLDKSYDTVLAGNACKK